MRARKVIKTIVAVALVCVMLCTLVACDLFALKGTYTSVDGIVEQSFTFKEDNMVEISAFGINVEGEYEIEGDTITIRYSLLNLSYDMQKSFAKEGDSIFIDGVEFVKEK